MGRLTVAIVALVAVSCSDGGPTETDTSYNLTCPAAPTECGSLAASTCLGSGGVRNIVGVNGGPSCDDEPPVVAICEATERADGDLILTLVASVGDGFGFSLRGATIDPEGSMVMGSCEITIVEDQASYGGNAGRCGSEPPSMEQPCRISNVTLGGADADLSFDVECENLVDGVSNRAFDVGGTNGGAATVRFLRCDGL